MKSNFPRHANVPADFIFIGKGGTFEPAYRDAYYYVTKDGFCEALNFHCEKSDYADSEGVDFYVKKNGPTHLLNKPKVKKKTAPAITPLPEILKASLPKGYVYLGKGGEFKTPKEKCICTFTHCGDYESPLKWGDCWERKMCSSPESYYAFPINSEIARLNGVNPNNNFLIEENARLQKELDELKRKIAAFIAGVK